MYRMMRTSVLNNLALLVFATLVNTCITSSLDSTGEPETTPLADMVSHDQPSNPQGNIGEQRPDALGDAFRQVAQGLLRVEEALRLQEQEARRRVQKALRIHEQRAARVLREAVRLLEQWSQERDETVRQMEQRLQERDETVRQMNHRLQERDEAVHKMEHRLHERDEAVRQLELRLEKRDEAALELENRLQKWNETMSQMENRLQERDEDARQMEQRLEKRDEVVRQMELLLQERDGTVRQMELRLQEREEAVRQMDQRLQERDEALSQMDHRLQEWVKVAHQMEQRLQEGNETFHALRHTLHDRIQRVEESLGELAVQHNPPSKKDGDAASQEDLSLDQLENRLMKLEATVEKVLEHFQLAAKVRQPTEPTSTDESPTDEHSYPSTFMSSIFVSTSPEPPTRMPLGTTMTEVEATVDEERERARLERRLLKVKARRDKARTEPSLLGEDLCRAAFDGRVEEVRRLLDSGADVNYTSSHGTSPLISAFFLPYKWQNANPGVLSLLLGRGADVSAIDSNGWTALHYAAEYDSTGNSVSVLLGAGADANARDDDGATPLHRILGWWYMWSDNDATVRVLLAAGAKKSLRCWSGWWTNMTPFDVAVSVTAGDSSSSRDLLRLLRP